MDKKAEAGPESPASEQAVQGGTKTDCLPASSGTGEDAASGNPWRRLRPEWRVVWTDRPTGEARELGYGDLHNCTLQANFLSRNGLANDVAVQMRYVTWWSDVWTRKEMEEADRSTFDQYVKRMQEPIWQS